MIGSAVAWANRNALREVLPPLGLALLFGLAIGLLPLTWATLLVAGSLVVVATLVEPRLGVLLLLPAVPFGSVRQVRVGVMNVGLAEVLLGLVLAAWLARQVARREIRWRPKAVPPLALPLGLWLGAALVSMPGAASPLHSLKEILKWVEFLALYVLVANETGGFRPFRPPPDGGSEGVDGQRWRRALVAGLLVAGAVAALQGIYQFLFQVGPEGFVLFDRFMRAYGTFEQPNPYGGYLGLVLPVAVGPILAWLVPAGRRPGPGWLALAAVCGGLVLAALVMSWSRGAWLGFGAALVAMGLAVVAHPIPRTLSLPSDPAVPGTRGGTRAGRGGTLRVRDSGRGAVVAVTLATLVIYGLLAGGLALVPPSIVQRFDDFLPYMGVMDVRGVEITDANFSVLERMAHWQAALDMWADHLWLGVGIGNYEVAYAAYAPPLWPLALGHAHNYYLNAAAETGLVGLLAYLLLSAAALWWAWRTARRAQGWSWGLALGVLGVVVHLTVHNLFDNLHVHGMYLHVAILLGLAAGLAELPAGEPAPEARARIR